MARGKDPADAILEVVMVLGGGKSRVDICLGAVGRLDPAKGSVGALLMVYGAGLADAKH